MKPTAAQFSAISPARPGDAEGYHAASAAPAGRGGWLRWLLSVGIAAVVIAGLLISTSWLAFGSVTDGVHWLRGEPLTLEAATIVFPPSNAGEQRELAFEVTNLSFRPVHLLGGASDCSCVKIGGLPVVVPARTSVRVPVTVLVRAEKAAPTEFSRPVVLTTQLENQPRLVGRIEGRVLSTLESEEPLRPVPDEAFSSDRDVTP